MYLFQTGVFVYVLHTIWIVFGFLVGVVTIDFDFVNWVEIVFDFPFINWCIFSVILSILFLIGLIFRLVFDFGFITGLMFRVVFDFGFITGWFFNVIFDYLFKVFVFRFVVIGYFVWVDLFNFNWEGTWTRFNSWLDFKIFFIFIRSWFFISTFDNGLIIAYFTFWVSLLIYWFSPFMRGFICTFEWFSYFFFVIYPIVLWVDWDWFGDLSWDC